jgi:flagellar protein FlaG
MIGNAKAVTVEPARTPPSIPHAEHARPESTAAKPGNVTPAGGEQLPLVQSATLDPARTVQRLNELSAHNRRNLEFQLDELSGGTLITVFNAATRELVRQIPSEELRTIERTFEYFGSLLDASA